MNLIRGYVLVDDYDGYEIAAKGSDTSEGEIVIGNISIAICDSSDSLIMCQSISLSSQMTAGRCRTQR